MKKICTILIFSLLVWLSPLFSAQAQCTIPNAGFESWTDDMPDNWFAFTCRQSTGRNGGFSIETDTTVSFPFFFLPTFGTATPCTQRSSYLNGYIKASFSAVDSDTMFFTVGFKLQGDTVPGAFGGQYTFTNRPNWTPFHIPIANMLPGAVDTLVITAFNGGYDSFVAFDDLSLSNTPLGAPLGTNMFTANQIPVLGRPARARLDVSPNPATESTTLCLTGFTGTTTLRLLDNTGKVVRTVFSGPVTGTLKLPLVTAGLTPGIYLLHAEGAPRLSRRIVVPNR